MEEVSVTNRRVVSGAAVLSTAALLMALVPSTVAQSPAASPAGPVLAVKAVYSSVIEEPWDGVVNGALDAEAASGRITHTYQDGVGYDGQMEFVLREVAETEHPDIIFGDAFGNEEAVRKVAADYPDIPFVFGSGGGPAEPNFSVFDNWIHEPAYLAGMLAGGLTQTGTVGIVAGYPVPEVNRLANAFIAGAQAQNPAVEVKVAFINSWFDPATAKEAALAQIGAGADVLYAERSGVIEAATEQGVLAIGNMSDQSAEGPESVITSVTWDMVPTVDYVVDQVLAGSYTSQDLKDFSMVAKGGAALAPINTALVAGRPGICPPAADASPAMSAAPCTGQDVIDAVMAKEADIVSGIVRVDINESQPAGSTVVQQ